MYYFIFILWLCTYPPPPPPPPRNLIRHCNLNILPSSYSPGDYEGAVDTLRMAITLIKQSVTAGTESSQILIQSLQECLHSIDEQAAMAK